jgi:membrane protein
LIASGRSRFGHARAETGDFIRRVWNKADQDEIFFMASAIAFNVLVAIVPLALAALGIASIIFGHLYFGNPVENMTRVIEGALPDVSGQFVETIENLLTPIFQNSKGVTTIGLIGFIWFATRLIGTLRAALRNIFDLQQDRSIILGKLFDMKMVLVAGALLTLNVGVTLLVDYVAARGQDFLGVITTGFWNGFIANLTAFLSIWTMFLLIYRYVPARRISWQTAMISTTFASTLFEIMKRAFTYYASQTRYGSNIYGNLAIAAVLVIWVYYTAMAFILGGEVGQVYSLRRIRKRQKERLG